MDVAPSQSRRRSHRRYLAWSLVLLGTAVAILAIVLSQNTSTQSPTNPIPNQPTDRPALSEPAIGLHVPWAIGGPAIERDGARSERAPEYPDLPLATVRLWDTRTAWLNLEPRQDLWDFTNLDAHIDQAHAHGIYDITLVLWGTPTWAASSTAPTDANWLGPGSASMPTNMVDWEDYVTTVATRYRHVITAYEIGNEPNVEAFWTGTDAELAQLVQSAARIIHQVDPHATVVAPAPVFVDSQKKSLRAATTFWARLTDPTSNSNTANNPNVDALSFHWYPSSTTAPRELKAVVRELTNQATRAGMPGIALWLTEVNYYQGGLSPEQQSAKVSETNDVIKQLRIPRTYWYAWTDLGPLDFMQFGAGTPAEKGLRESLAAH